MAVSLSEVKLGCELDQARKVLLCQGQLPEIVVAESRVGSRPYYGIGHVERFAAEGEPVPLRNPNRFLHGQIGEKIYYDRGTVLKQVGVFHEPGTVLGQISILGTHPITIARALARKFLRSDS